jgi:hypothetical protein
LKPGDCGSLSSLGEALGLFLGEEATVTLEGEVLPGFVYGITLIPPLLGLQISHKYTIRFLSISSAWGCLHIHLGRMNCDTSPLRGFRVTSIKLISHFKKG